MYFGADFPEMSDSEKLFCGIWTFLIVIVGHSISLSCHFRFWRGKPEDPRVEPGDDTWGDVRDKSEHDINKRKPEYGERTGREISLKN